MHSSQERIVSTRTQSLFQVLVCGGTDVAGLLALVTSAYADGGCYVLDQMREKITADSDD